MKFNINDTRSFSEVIDELASNWNAMSRKEQEKIISMFVNN